ncbi:Ribosomal 50S subunit-recycling heat shock protein, contains S4 domain, partial [Dysosmobacter welbionis]
RQVHEALAEGVETLLVNLADGEDSEKVADIVGDAGVVLLNRAPGTAILNERMVFVGMDEAGSGALQGHALAEYFWETDHGTD